MAYRSNSNGCGCIIVFIIVMAIIAGIRGCTEKLINGDLKLPKLGSSHVGSGSGGNGTSNGYNVEYNQTSSPSNNGSLEDYTHTNDQPTEYQDGRSTSPSSSNSVYDSPSRSMSVDNSSSNYSSSSAAGNNTTISNRQGAKTYYKTCGLCGGKGKRTINEWYFGEVMWGRACPKCGRSDEHCHSEIVECDVCSGKGKIKMEIVDGPFGEMEIRAWDI